MEPFDADWLALREPVDHRSRDEGLLAPLSDAWRAHGWSRVLDLGTGTGSNVRYLTTRLPSGQEWVALDHDSALLAVLGRAVTPTSLRSLTLVSGDLAHEGLAAVPHADLVTASALLDLVSEDWLRRLVDACVAADRAAYFALSYDGEIRWWGGTEPGGSEEADPDDALVRDAVNVHQTGEKALGPGLGPTAGRCAERLFRAAGYVTRHVQSPWQLGAADSPLAYRLIDGWAVAATEVRPDVAGRIRAWADRRRATVASGRFALTVGHCDLLALPAPRS